MVDSAREVIRRVIDVVLLFLEAALVADFAVNNGIEVDSCYCGALITKLNGDGRGCAAEAEALFVHMEADSYFFDNNVRKDIASPCACDAANVHLENQYSDDTVVIVSPDSDNLSVLQAGIQGLDLPRNQQLYFGPGELEK